ncbi:MAG: hypothetical protein HWE27_16340 [Gammaproteobacteria bacterium]|nr:hypothetical protein [Gammaproteobacteria bacterium]
MPIVYCYTTLDLPDASNELVEQWSSLSGISSEEMTVNFVELNEQVGKQYDVMAQLFLPDLWNEADINRLQIGLAEAISEVVKVSIKGVHVITQIVTSGTVVENGKVLTW